MYQSTYLNTVIQAVFLIKIHKLLLIVRTWIRVSEVPGTYNADGADLEDTVDPRNAHRCLFTHAGGITTLEISTGELELRE